MVNIRYERSPLLAVSVICAVVMCSLGACSSSEPGSADGALVVGLDAPLTGSAASTGQGEADGMQARYELENSKGGVGGHRIKFVTADDQNDPGKAPAAVRSLVESEKAISLSIVSSAAGQAVQPYLTSKHVVDLPLGGSDSITKLPKTTARLVSPAYDAMAAAAVDYGVKTLHKTKVAVAYTADAVGIPALAGVKSELKALGLPLVAAEEFTATSTSLTPQAAKLKAAGADFVVIIHNAAVGSLLFKACNSIGYKPTFGSAYVMANASLADIMSGSIDGRIVFSSPFPDQDSPGFADMKTWATKSGGDPAGANFQLGWLVADAQVALLQKAVDAADGKVPTSAQVVAAADGLKVDDDYVRGLDWSNGNRYGITDARMIGMKGDAFPVLSDFAPLPKVSRE